MALRRLFLTSLLLASGLGCATARNYEDPAAPVYTGGAALRREAGRTLRVVTFNLKWGKEIDRAVAHPQCVDAVAVVVAVVRLHQVGRRALRHAPGALADGGQRGLAGRRPGRAVGQDDPHQPTGSGIRR